MGKINDSIKALKDLLYLRRKKDFQDKQLSERQQVDLFKIYSPETIDGIIHIGKYSYVAANTFISDCEIGNFSSIGPNCVIGGGQHPLNWPSTSPVFYNPDKITIDSFVTEHAYPLERERIRIGNDVWIGANAYVRNGISIGDGAVIAAGAVVVSDVLPYSIVGGVPARLIKKRFPDEIIEKLLALKWWDRDINELRKLQPYFASDDIKAFIHAFTNKTES
jgi:acetyltransferase-like isoleucine patch superfamily enzyme